MNALLAVSQTVSDSLAAGMASGQNPVQSSSPGDIYIVLVVTLVVWLGIFAYLFFLNREINQLKKEV